MKFPKSTKLISLSLILLTSCVHRIDEDPVPDITVIEEALQFSSEFDFKTSKEVRVHATNGNGIYSLSYGADQEYLIGKYATTDKPIVISIPGHLQTIHFAYTSKNGDSKSMSMDVLNQSTIALGLSKKESNANGRTKSCQELLYAVNNKGGFYRINVEDGSYASSNLGSLEGGGSIACAVDKKNGRVYYNVGQTLKYYDFNAGSYHTAQTGNPFNGSYPRMEYNVVDDNLYIAKNEKMYVLNPNTNEVISSFNIIGLAAPVGGGDIAISGNGTIYMCCFSGLYRIKIEGSNAIATRISGENLPFKPTSMAIDRNDRLYLATNDANSQLIEMDKFDGAWTVVQTYPHTINDLGSFKCSISELSTRDSDNDGVIDAQDDYPNDPDAATTAFTPSDIGWGSLAYEDLWPSKGDYDFNDLVLNYRFIQVENAQNDVVRLIAKFKIKAIGASLHNGFGLKIPVDPVLISSVTGANLTRNIITNNQFGLEEGHSSGSVVMVFDDAFDNVIGAQSGWFINTQEGAPKVEGNEIEITIQFVNPISAELIGLPPFDPFIFIGGDRGREVHLPDYAPTEKADQSFFNTYHDDSDQNNGKYYRGINNMPWAMNIIHDFRQPLEKTRIDAAYTKFRTWGESNGLTYKDWYTDIGGYRNLSKIYND